MTQLQNAEQQPVTDRNARYTSGEWFVDAKGNVYAKDFYHHAPFTDVEGHDHPDYYSGLVALTYSQGDGTMKGNAQLMAAAPKLLAALKMLRERHAIDDPHHEHLCQVCRQADAAIATAEGRTA